MSAVILKETRPFDTPPISRVFEVHDLLSGAELSLASRKRNPGFNYRIEELSTEAWKKIEKIVIEDITKDSQS